VIKAHKQEIICKNYRIENQKWIPHHYQVGDLVMPLVQKFLWDCLAIKNILYERNKFIPNVRTLLMPK
jgi:hypothetical protein